MCPDYLVCFLTFLSLFHNYNIIIYKFNFLLFLTLIQYFCTVEVAAVNSVGTGNYSKPETVYMSSIKVGEA